jgi:hypothetical protein
MQIDEKYIQNLLMNMMLNFLFFKKRKSNLFIYLSMPLHLGMNLKNSSLELSNKQ